MKVSPLLILLCVAPAFGADANSGEAVYRARCAVCHDLGNPNIPGRDVLKRLTTARILRALESGEMMAIGAPLRKEERESVAGFLGRQGTDVAFPPEAYCRDQRVRLGASPKFAWSGWGPGLSNMRFQTIEAAGLTVEQIRNLKLKWAFGFADDLTSFSQPAILDGQVFVGSSAGAVYALRAETGCIQWTYQATAPVRSAMLVASNGNRHALLFGDLTARVYALEAESGRLLWKYKADDHGAARVTGSPAADNGVVYVPVSSWEETGALRPGYACCTFRGSVVALRIRDGKLLWKTYAIAQEPKQTGNTDGRQIWGPAGAGIWSAPTIDRKRRVLYVTTGNNYSGPPVATSDAILALDLSSGRIAWSRQVTPNDVFSGCGGENCGSERGPDFDFGSSAMLVTTERSRDLILAGQKSGTVYALDPDRMGEIVWQTRVAKGSAHGGIQWGMASDARNVYAPIADGDYKRVAGANGVPKQVLDPEGGGGLTALRVADGTIAWHADPVRACTAASIGCSPAQLAAATSIPSAVFSGAMDGHLRAYSPEDGKILWDVDTNRPFATVNGVAAHGGALNGAGAVVANGMVLVNSGYDHFNSMTGNVLLAFTPDK